MEFFFDVLVNTHPLKIEETGDPSVNHQREEGRKWSMYTVVLVPIMCGSEVPLLVRKASLTGSRLRGKAQRQEGCSSDFPLFDVQVDVGDGRIEEQHGVDGNAVVIVAL
jgi:hypothetical protein